MKNKPICIFFIASLTALSVGFLSTGCGKSNKSDKDVRQQLLDNTWNFLKTDLKTTKTSAEKLKAAAQAFCVSGSGSIDDVKNAWKETYTYLLRQDFLDFTTNYKVSPSFGRLRKRLDSKPVNATAITAYYKGSGPFEVKDIIDNNDLLGLPVIEFLLYDTTDPLTKGSNKCKLLTSVTDIAATNIDEFNQDWNDKKDAFLKPETSKSKGYVDLWNTKKKAIDEILQHSAKMIERMDKEFVAAPSARNDETGEKTTATADYKKTEAPYAKLGAYFVKQAIIDGLQAYYTAGFPGASADDVSLQKALKASKPEVAKRIDDAFKAVDDALKPFLPPGSLEEAIQNGTKGNEIKALIVALHNLAQSFRSDARDTLGVADSSANGDND